MSKKRVHPTAEEQNAAGPPSRPSSSDELRSAGSGEWIEQPEINRIAKAQVELLGALAKIAVEKLHGKSACGQSESQTRR
jgi:hypothetical protein